jgi:hypothetical protein
MLTLRLIQERQPQKGRGIRYPVNELALTYGARVETARRRRASCARSGGSRPRETPKRRRSRQAGGASA